MKAYKGFEKGLICRGFQFKENKVFEQQGEIEVCKNGFHFCENPLDVLDYYNLCDSEFAIVEAIGDVKTEGNKSVTNKIKIGAKLGLNEFINEAFSFLWKKCNAESGDAASGDSSQLAASGYSCQLAASGDSSQLAASGDYSKLAASGDYSKLVASGHHSQLAASGYSCKLAASGDSSQLAASGDYSQLAASGYFSKLAASGDSSQLAASGDYSKLAASGYSCKLAASGDYSKLAASGNFSQLETTGEYSVAAGVGVNNTVKGKAGCWITLAEWEYNKELGNFVPTCVKTAQIDGVNLKPDVWYKLENGEFVECN